MVIYICNIYTDMNIYIYPYIYLCIYLKIENQKG